MNSRLCRKLELDFPLIQSGMGGITSPELVAAVSNAGCAGVLGFYKFNGDQIRDQIARTASLTDRCFGVNLIPEIVNRDFLLAQLQSIFDNAPKNIFLLFYGLPEDSVWEFCRQHSFVFFAQVAHHEVEEGIRMGFDGLVLQGIEAGGHLLGTLDLDDSLRETAELFSDTILVVSGGIGSGTQLARFMNEYQQVDGALCGTLFVATTESLAHGLYKEKILESNFSHTTICDTFVYGWPGRRHRVLSNRVTENAELPSSFIATIRIGQTKNAIPRFSANVPTIYTEGAINEMAMYCGKSCEEISEIKPASEVIDQFKQEFAEKYKR